MALILRNTLDKLINSLSKPRDSQMKALSPPLKIALIYCFFGVLWIFFSDRLLGLLISDHQTLNVLQTFKGWIYVAITTLLLYLLI
ncbi:MAG: hypothetical protein RL368_1786, partial [Pseudomonadota bacterium]